MWILSVRIFSRSIFIIFIILLVFSTSSGDFFDLTLISTLITGITLWILALLIFSYLWAYLTYKYYFYELRNEGIRIEKGVIWKKYTTIPYDRIQNVDIHRGIVARLVGLSEVDIQTAGASSGRRRRTAEGTLPGLRTDVAKDIRNKLVNLANK